MAESLSIEQARKLVLLSQRIPPVNLSGPAIAGTLSAIEHLGYIQIDTISVIERAHHHTLWNRNTRYSKTHLDQLVETGKVFEYWSHAAAYLPMRDYRYSLPRKHAIKTGKQTHWFTPNLPLMNSVLNRIKQEGPLMARDFENHGGKTGEWQSKPAKKALECLFMQGDLMVSTRRQFHKVYDLTERVLPSGINTSIPTADEYARHLIHRYLSANGLGQRNEMNYLRKNTKSILANTLQELVSNNEIIEFSVKDQIYYTLPSAIKLLSKPLSRKKLKILSPFDNVLIQRKRMQALFGFDYQLECYVPASKRKYGYFSLPILWDGRFVARMDCKVERKTSTLLVKNIILEPDFKKIEAFSEALNLEIDHFLAFNNCENVMMCSF